MKKFCLFLLLPLLLCGCGTQETFETVDDEHVESVMQEQKTVLLTVEEDALTLQGDTGTIYLCDGYDLTVEIMDAGNLSGTFQNITGFGMDDLTVMETSSAEAARYECVWSAAGEGGDMVGRAVILDDGVYHYCVTVLADAEDALALQETWKEIFDSFELA